MLRQTIILIVSFMLTGLSVGYSQTSWTYRGTLFSSDSTLLLKNIDVTNLRTKQMLRSEFDGKFSIDAQPSDTIEFKHPHWVTTKLLAMELQDVVFLEKKTIILDAIVIVGNTKASKIRELQQMKKDNNVKSGLYYSGNPPWYHLLPFGGATVTYFYEKFSKAGKNARKFEKFMQQEIENMEVDQIFNKTSINGIIPMENEELEKFMVQYRPSFEESRYWTEYDLHVYLKKHFKEFKNADSELAN